MSEFRTLCMMVNDPQRAHVALHAVASLIRLPAETDGLGRASCVDDSVLLKRQPSPPADDALYQILGDTRARCTLVNVRTSSDLRPKHTSPKNMAPYRSKTYAFSSSLGPNDPDLANELREKHLSTLPDFLRRNVEGQSESEAFFFAVLAKLHKLGELRVGRPSEAAIAQTLNEVLDESGDTNPRHISFASPTRCVHVARNAPLIRCVVDGLDLQRAEELDPTLVDSSMGKERLSRFSGILLGGYKGDLPLDDISGVDIRRFPEGGTLWMSSSLESGEL